MKITLNIPPIISDALVEGFNYQETVMVEQGIDEETGLPLMVEIPNPISKMVFCKRKIVEMMKGKCKGFKHREREDVMSANADIDNDAIDNASIT